MHDPLLIRTVRMTKSPLRFAWSQDVFGIREREQDRETNSVRTVGLHPSVSLNLKSTFSMASPPPSTVLPHWYYSHRWGWPSFSSSSCSLRLVDYASSHFSVADMNKDSYTHDSFSPMFWTNFWTNYTWLSCCFLVHADCFIDQYSPGRRSVLNRTSVVDELHCKMLCYENAGVHVRSGIEGEHLRV